MYIFNILLYFVIVFIFGLLSACFLIGNALLMVLPIAMLSEKFNFSKLEDIYWLPLFAFTFDVLWLFGFHPKKILNSILDLIHPYMIFKDDKDKVIKHNNNNNKERKDNKKKRKDMGKVP